jgi:ABC-type sugar transport system ATPase subunit
MVVLDQVRRGLQILRRKEEELAEYYVNNFAIRIASLNQLAMNLSGGTQQKVVLSKWLATKPRVLIFDEPTRGIDVGAKVEIYRVINQLAKQGVAILVISSELPEVLGISDRILVMGGGQIRGELTRQEASEEKIMELATGAEKAESHLFQL